MPDAIRAFVAVTDNDWFRFLSAQEALDEVNFLATRPEDVGSER